MASIFLDSAAELARAHRASSARATHCCYIRQLSQSRHRDLSLCGQKWVCFHCVPLPKSIYRDCINQLLSRVASISKSLSLWKIRRRGGQLHISYMFSVSYRAVIYRARANIQWKEGSGLGRRQVKARNICPFKGISSLVCSESTPGVSALHW